MRVKISFGDLFKKSICYLLIFQIIAVDLVRASHSSMEGDDGDARALVLAKVDEGSPLLSRANPGLNKGSIQSLDEENGRLGFRNGGEKSFEEQIKNEIKRIYHRKIHTKISPTDVVIFAFATVLGIGALQALEALTAAGAFDLLHIPRPESDTFGAFYASTAAVHFVMFSEFIPFTYSSILGVSSIKEIILEGYDGIKEILKKAIQYLRKQPQDQQKSQPWRSKHWSVLGLEIVNLTSSTVYSLILVGILVGVEHKYPLFYKIFGPPLGIMTFLDKVTTGHRKAVKTSRWIQGESEAIAKMRERLILTFLKAKQYLVKMDDSTLMRNYRILFPGYLRILPMATEIPAENAINPKELGVNDFDFDVLPALLARSQFEQINHSQFPNKLSGLGAIMAWYALCSVMFQSLETFNGYHWILYPLSLISGTWIPYVEYDDVKELFIGFKEKVLHWGEIHKKKFIIASNILAVSLAMFVAFIYNYSEFKEVHNPNEEKHGFIPPLNNNKIFNWAISIPLLIFEMLSMTALQYAAYGALKFLTKAFSRWSITEVSSYRERFVKLMDSFMEVVEEASAEGLETIESMISPRRQAAAEL